MKSRSFLSLVALTLAFSLLLNVSPCVFASANEQSGSSSSSSQSISASELLKQGTSAMASGKYSSAIKSFDEAILLDPTAYLSYYRRATASLSMGKTSSALSDLDHLLKLKPEFSQAYLTKANILTKEGELQSALESINQFLKLNTKSSSSKGKELKDQIESGIKEMKSLQSTFSKNKLSKSKAEQCNKHATSVLEISPNHLEARSKRAECRIMMGEIQDAMADWSRIVNLAPSTDLLLRLSSLKYYITGDDASSREAGLSHLKTCLSSDPDNKRCARAHKKLRAVEKQLKKAVNFAEGAKWRQVVSSLKGIKVGAPTVMQNVESNIKADMESTSEGENSLEPVIPTSIPDAVERSGLLHYMRQLHCRAHTELKELAKAKPYCDAVLAREPDYVWGLVSRGDSAMKEENYEEAMRVYQSTHEKSGGNDESIASRYQKAQRLHKQANSKDYYKILGVSRSSDAGTIKKAYRKLAKEHHPDKGGSAEKMASINEAFDVLSDSEKKAQFDSGVDPNDPMAQAQAQQGGGNPFMFQQGGGGHQFMFQQGGGNPFGSFFQQQQGGGGFRSGGGGGGWHFDF